MSVNRLETIMRDFLGERAPDGKRDHLVAWVNVCKSLEEVGLWESSS